MIICLSFLLLWIFIVVRPGFYIAYYGLLILVVYPGVPFLWLLVEAIYFRSKGRAALARLDLWLAFGFMVINTLVVIVVNSFYK